MILTAGELTEFQRCPRRWRMQALKVPRQWNAPTLYAHVLRESVLELARGVRYEDVVAASISEFMTRARDPGLTIGPGLQPYTLASDFCAILRTTLYRIRAAGLPELAPGPTVRISNEVEWRVSAFEDDKGNLHAWRPVAVLNNDVLAQLLHSWYVFAELAATGRSMALHVIEIGRRVGEHQATPWCRAFRHPVMPTKIAFQRRDKSPLAGRWKAVWYQDSSRNDPDVWCRLMERDNVSLLTDVSVGRVSPAQGREFKRQALIEAARMEAVAGLDWPALPMSRPSCDAPPCGFQHFCFPN